MKLRTVLILVVVLAVLVGLVVMKNRGKETPDIVEQAGFVSILPEGLDSSDIGRIELFAGAKVEQKVVLAKNNFHNPGSIQQPLNTSLVQARPGSGSIDYFVPRPNHGYLLLTGFGFNTKFDGGGVGCLGTGGTTSSSSGRDWKFLMMMSGATHSVLFINPLIEFIHLTRRAFTRTCCRWTGKARTAIAAARRLDSLC